MVNAINISLVFGGSDRLQLHQWQLGHKSSFEINISHKFYKTKDAEIYSFSTALFSVIIGYNSTATYQLHFVNFSCLGKGFRT